MTWLKYAYPLIDALQTSTDYLEGLHIASLTDIGLMKLVAVSQRGARKDFIDLFAIDRHGISVPSLLALMPNKFPGAKINYYHIVKSLTFFDDAEREPMPKMLAAIEWNEVKRFFEGNQKIFMEKASQMNS